MVAKMLVVFAFVCGAAAFELSNQFATSMVLQREPLSACLHGTATAGESITLTLAGSSSWKSTADATGHWRICMDPQPAGGPHSLDIIAGEDASARACNGLLLRPLPMTSLSIRNQRHLLLAPHSEVQLESRPLMHVALTMPARSLRLAELMCSQQYRGAIARTASHRLAPCTTLVLGTSCSAKSGIALGNQT
jgi:hypothetical protein